MRNVNGFHKLNKMKKKYELAGMSYGGCVNGVKQA
jgi:hypothetical protein